MNARRLILAALAAASLGLGFPFAGLAQNAGDPPARVGRVAQISGTVSFHTSDETQWQAATENYPVTSGNSFWTEPRSHAAIDVGPSRLYMDSSTELDIGTLNDQGFVASIPQGAVYLRVSDAAGTTPFEIDTPRGRVQISQPGHYEIVAGDADHPTTVTSYDGGAQVTGNGVNLSLGPQQAAAISGQDQFQVATGQAQQPDDFVQFVQNQEQPYQNQAAQAAPQDVSPGMTGAQDLNQYGSWQASPDYGQVWYPQVASNWAPYRYGHWAYVAPWGWTWIDDAPWGFAPFHYGRWIDDGGRWGWLPGAYEPQPVYAPALVSFFGDFGGIGIGVSIGFGDVGWVPLGPDEFYYPGYYVSEPCFRQLNVAYVHNTTIINNYYNAPQHGDFNHYRNHDHGATMVRGDDMQHSRNIGQAWHKMPQDGSGRQWANARAFGGEAPVKPSFATAGVTPKTAHQFGLNAPAGSLPQHRSPGPAFAGGQAPNAQNANGNGQALAGNGGNGQFNKNLPPLNANQTRGQSLANSHGTQPQFGVAQNGSGQNGKSLNNGLVGRYMQTPPLSGGNRSTNGQIWAQNGQALGGQAQFGNGSVFKRNVTGTQAQGNLQNNGNLARNYFQQPAQGTNGSRNLQNNGNLARNYFQQPTQGTNGSGVWQNKSNQAQGYFQQPAQGTNGSRKLQNNGSLARNTFQQPIQGQQPFQGSNGSGVWQNKGNQAQGYFQQPAQGNNGTRNIFQQPSQATNGSRNWQNNGGQAQSFFQQPTQRVSPTFNQGGGQGAGFFQQAPKQQRNVVSNNFQGQGGNAFTRQQVQQPRNSQPQPQVFFQKKKTNNGN